jgi:hypothetical protein
MTERGLPIVDGAPACPFVAFADERDERATSPDHRHRCYAEPQPASRALAHQEAYCLSAAFPVCPTFQDWARREAARARDVAAKTADADARAADAAIGQQRNPPRNWAAPPPWLSRRGRSADEPQDSLWADGDADPGATAPDAAPAVPPRGRGLSGSYADRVASDPSVAIPGGMADLDDLDEPVPAAPPSADRAAAPAYHAPDSWDDDLAEEGPEPPRIRRRERDLVRSDRTGQPERPGAKRPGVAPEWERAKPLEAYPTIKSRRLTELSVPPILVAVVALAIAAAVLFALPGLLGFGSPGSGVSASPTLPSRTATPSINPTPIPQPTPQIYLVQSGDTMSRIAGRFGIPLQDLINANTDMVPDPNKLQIGQQVIIPAKAPTELPAASGIPGAT